MPPKKLDPGISEFEAAMLTRSVEGHETQIEDIEKRLHRMEEILLENPSKFAEVLGKCLTESTSGQKIIRQVTFKPFNKLLLWLGVILTAAIPAIISGLTVYYITRK